MRALSHSYHAIRKRMWRAGVRKGRAPTPWSDTPWAIAKRRFRLKRARRGLIETLLALEIARSRAK